MSDTPNPTTPGPAEPAAQAAAQATDVAIQGAVAAAGLGNVGAGMTALDVHDETTGITPIIPASVPAAAAFHDGVMVPSEQMVALLEDLNELERIALFWGGDRGVQIRNIVCRQRLTLFGQ